MRDMDGQPPRGTYIHRLVDRQITEMLGMAKGIICDGVVNDAEVVALKQWLRENSDVTVKYPGQQLAERIVSMWADGVIDEVERAELRDMLFDLAGEADDLAGNMNMPTSFPLDNPPPTVIFDGKTFVFTGIFASGSRPSCQKKVADRGGRCIDDITLAADYLVVGLMTSPAWVQSTHGRKIERAIDMKGKGHRIAMIAEPHWMAAL